MGYKERVRDEIKQEELRGLWQKISSSYEQGGNDQVKSDLNSLLNKIKKDYKQILERLGKML